MSIRDSTMIPFRYGDDPTGTLGLPTLLFFCRDPKVYTEKEGIKSH